MIALFPLGGYVKMLGEGADNDEADTDPRSFKNKPVWQRMAIISAGVTMNLVLAFACFVFVFRTRGDEQTPSVISTVEAGSPAWKVGAREGDVISWIGNKGPNPSFSDELMPAVMFSKADQPLRFVFGPPDDPEKYKTEVIPRREERELRPVIGVTPPPQLQLISQEMRKPIEVPALLKSAAARAEPAFHFDDAIIGTTDPAHPDQVTPLPADPRNPVHLDYFEFRRRMHDLAGQPAIIRVRRSGQTEPVDIRVPPAYHYTFGLHMRMGKIVGVRNDSPAAHAGLQTDDIIDQVEVMDGQTKIRFVPRARKAENHVQEVVEKDLDPERLPFELSQLMAKANGPKEVTLVVLRNNPPPNHAQLGTVTLKLEWDDSWKYNQETGAGSSPNLSVPCLGLAYRIETTVAGVVPGSPADVAGLKERDVIKAVQFKASANSFEEWKDLPPDHWAAVASVLQRVADYPEIRLRVDREVTLTATEDTTWPLDDRGLLFLNDKRLVKASTLGQALALGIHKTTAFVEQVYGFLQGVSTGRVSWKLTRGPITIARAAFYRAENIYEYLVFLGIIGVNLAVVNFLPIPVLDGGHMVFLIYERLRGKPAPEQVRFAATMVGLTFILALMALVLYLDIGDLKFW
jgi:regulator of sigma E protease